MYKTHKINLAATLMALGYSYVGIENPPDRSYAYIFSYQEGLDAVLQMYYERKLQVEPQLLLFCLKDLKQELAKHVPC